MMNKTVVDLSIFNPCDPITPAEEWPEFQKSITLITLTLIILVIVFGNILVILSIISQASLRTPSNIYLLSLAFTDLTVAVCILPFNVIDMILQKWIYGQLWCRIWLTLDVTLCSTSILHLSAIAVDRYRIINEGIAYINNSTIKNNILVCICLWIIALWIASAPVLGWNDWTDSSDQVCYLTRDLGYIVHSALGAFFIPMIIMLTTYFKIYTLIIKKIRDRYKISCINSDIHSESFSMNRISQKERDFKPQGTDSKTDQVNSCTEIKKNDEAEDVISIAQEPLKSLPSKNLSEETCCTLKTKSSTLKSVQLSPIWKRIKLNKITTLKGARKQSQQITEIIHKKKKFSLTRERKATKTLGIIILAFIICWTPFTLTYLVSGVYYTVYNECVSYGLFQFVTWLGYVNSALNPIIYTIFSKDFKTGFKKVLKAPLFWINE